MAASLQQHSPRSENQRAQSSRTTKATPANTLTLVPLPQKRHPGLILPPPLPPRQLLKNPPIGRSEHRIVPLAPKSRNIRRRQSHLLVHGDDFGGLQLRRSAVEGVLHGSCGAAFLGREAGNEVGDGFCSCGLRLGVGLGLLGLRLGLLLGLAWGWWVGSLLFLLFAGGC